MSCSVNVDDRISRLPEEIVSRILSLMPIRFVVQTCILSKRWRYCWMFVTNLDFDDSHIPYIIEMCLYTGLNIHNYSTDLNKLTMFVDRVLGSYKSSCVELFRLHFIRMTVPSSSVSRWIDNAVSLNVREFDIHLIDLDLPLSLFTCKTLTKLRLDRKRDGDTDWECPCSVNLPCLKTLDIIAYTKPFVNVRKLVSGCPILESLSLEVEWNIDEEDYVFNVPTLKRLKLTKVGLICSGGSFERIQRTYFNHKIVLNVPNLEYMFIGGCSCSRFVFEDVSSLVQASVKCYEIAYDHLWVELLNGVSGVKSFSAEIERLFEPHIPFISPYPVFSNMNHMKLKGHWGSGQILQFLKNCPHLTHLCIEQGDDRYFKLEEEPKSVPTCMLKSLTSIEFSKRKDRWSDIEFLEYMFGNAEVLKTVTIIPENLCIEEETRLCAKLLKFPMASQSCEICFRGRFSPPTDIQLALVK